jgi:hypothetical protein
MVEMCSINTYNSLAGIMLSLCFSKTCHMLAMISMFVLVFGGQFEGHTIYFMENNYMDQEVQQRT